MQPTAAHTAAHTAALTAALTALALAATVTLAGCASQQAAATIGSTPTRREFVAVGDQVVQLEPSTARTRSEALDLPVDRAWAAIPLAFESLGLVLTTLDSDARRIGAGGQRVQGRLKGTWMSRYVDCGTGANGIPHADSYAITLDVLSRLQGRADGGGAEVSTVVRAVGRASSVGSNNPVNCTSNGNLERKIAELVRQEATRTQ